MAGDRRSVWSVSGVLYDLSERLPACWRRSVRGILCLDDARFSAALSLRPTYLLISPPDRDRADAELICVFQPDGMVGIAMMASIGEASGGVRAVGRGRKLPRSAPIAVVVHRC
jgi:hypothetical protein